MNRRSKTRRVAAIALPILAATLVSCAGTTSSPKARFVAVEEGGFTIEQKVRARGRVRSDFERAVQMLEAEDYQAGILLLEEIVAEAPDATTAYINLGIAYNRVDELDRAEASIQKAIELNPKHPAAYNELGIVQRRMGRFEAARTTYERSLELYPGFHFARRNLAILCDVYLGDLECALDNYERYAQAVPTDGEAAMWIADLRNRLGR